MCRAMVRWMWRLAVQGCYSAGRAAFGATTNNFFQTSCSAITYPVLCYYSFSSHASTIQQKPELLANVALSFSLDTARTTSVDMVKLSHGDAMTTPICGRHAGLCEGAENSMDLLRKAITEMDQIEGSNYKLKISDIQTWICAALTDEEACMDGFAGKAMNGGIRATVRGKIVNVEHMTNNALALVNGYASFLHG